MTFWIVLIVLSLWLILLITGIAIALKGEKYRNIGTILFIIASAIMIFILADCYVNKSIVDTHHTILK